MGAGQKVVCQANSRVVRTALHKRVLVQVERIR
jgi:hypothetical protein